MDARQPESDRVESKYDFDTPSDDSSKNRIIRRPHPTNPSLAPPYRPSAALSTNDINKMRDDLFESQVRVREAKKNPPPQQPKLLINCIDTIDFPPEVRKAKTVEIDQSLNVIMPGLNGNRERQNTFLMLAARYHKDDNAFLELIKKASLAALDVALDKTNASGQSALVSIIKYQKTASISYVIENTDFDKLTTRLKQKIYPSEGGFTLYWLPNLQELENRYKKLEGLTAVFVGDYPNIILHLYLNGKPAVKKVEVIALQPDDRARLTRAADGKISLTADNAARINQIITAITTANHLPDNRETIFMLLVKYHGESAVRAIMRRSILLAQELMHSADVRFKTLATAMMQDEMLPMKGDDPRATFQIEMRIHEEINFLVNTGARMKKHPDTVMRFLQRILPSNPQRIRDTEAWQVILHNALLASCDPAAKDNLLAMLFRVYMASGKQANNIAFTKIRETVLAISTPEHLSASDNYRIAKNLSSLLTEPHPDTEKSDRLRSLQHLYYAAKQGHAAAKKSLLKNHAEQLQELRQLLQDQERQYLEKSAGKRCGFFSRHDKELIRLRETLIEYSAANLVLPVTANHNRAGHAGLPDNRI
jgi:hypothetical protein